MKNRKSRKIFTDTLITDSPLMEQLDCFGDFNKANRLCFHHCAVRLRCAIEMDQFRRMEIIEDLVAAEDSLFRIQ